MLIFIAPIEAFETPALVGLPGRVHVLTNDIYQTMLDIPPNYGEASRSRVVMLVIMAFLLRLYGNFPATPKNIRPSAAKDFRPRVMAWKLALAHHGCAVVAVPGADRVPRGHHVWVSFVPYYDA